MYAHKQPEKRSLSGRGTVRDILSPLMPIEMLGGKLKRNKSKRANKKEREKEREEARGGGLRMANSANNRRGCRRISEEARANERASERARRNTSSIVFESCTRAQKTREQKFPKKEKEEEEEDREKKNTQDNV